MVAKQFLCCWHWVQESSSIFCISDKTCSSFLCGRPLSVYLLGTSAWKNRPHTRAGGWVHW